MGVRLAVVIFALTGLSYYHVRSTMTRRALDELESYVKARGEREQWLFDLARDNHLAVQAALLKRIRDYDGKDPDEELARRFVLYPDGGMRSRRETFDATRQAGAVFGNATALDAAARRRVLATQDTIEQMGPAFHTRFLNLWAATADNVAIAYWPEQPQFVFDTSPDKDFSGDALVQSASSAQDPERRSVWSDVYRDRTGQTGMVSVLTPMYDGDRFLGVIGHDVTLTEILERTIKVRIEGTYNLIVHQNGSLIAHPRLMDEINRTGKIDVTKFGDPGLLSIYQAVTSMTGSSGVVESDVERAYLGVARLHGPGWYLVTVYPKELLSQAASDTAWFVLLGGIASLLLETGILFMVLRSQVAAPLKELVRATDRVAAWERDVVVDERRNDELGRLGASFNQMAKAVREREEESERAEAAIGELNKELAANLTREREKNQTLERLRLAVDVLSAPVIEVWEDVIVLPVIGAVDDRRSAVMVAKVLEAVAKMRYRVVIIDVTGVEAMDEATATRLLTMVGAVELLGASAVLTGIKPSMAKTLAALNVDLRSIATLRTLKDGLRQFISRTGRAANARPIKRPRTIGGA